FSKIVAEQKVITDKARFLDFSSNRPATIPSGTSGATKDITICDNATALVQIEGKHEQIFLGTLVNIGNTWKLIDVPAVGSANQPANGGFWAGPNGAAP